MYTGLIAKTAHYTVDILLKTALLWRKLHIRLGPTANRYSYHRALPEDLRSYSPLLNAPRDKIFKKLLKGYKTHLDLGAGQSFYEFRRAFEQVLARLRAHPAESVPLVIESHSKMMEGHWDTLRRFIAYVRDEHSDVEFQTMSQYLRLLDANPEQIRSTPPAKN